MTTSTVKTTTLRTLIIAQVLIIVAIGIMSAGVLLSYNNINSTRDYKLCQKTQLISTAFLAATKSQRELLNDKFAKGQVTREQYFFSAATLDKNIKDLSKDAPCRAKPQ